jgi:UDP-N-acetyl-D-mannosaminuronic acid dehydrogenase
MTSGDGAAGHHVVVGASRAGHGQDEKGGPTAPIAACGRSSLITMGYDVAIIGCGRVGLPLALAFADRGLRVIGIDNDPALLTAVRAGRMPFAEPGAQDLLTALHGDERLQWSEHVADAAQARSIVITLGTPSFSHVEIDLRDIRSVLDDLLPVLGEGQLLVLRSTIAPGTTEFVAGYLEQQRGLVAGESVHVAHVPERIAASRFFEEIGTLPCIVGGVGERSGEAAEELFASLGAPVVHTTPINAELAKIWTNILRYAMFALPNRLMIECEQFGANVFEVIDLINRDYPRGGMPLPGMTAGTCLRKDFTFSEERSSAPGMLLAVSRVHESVPLFLVEGLKKRLGSLRGRRVAVLGLAFKADTDDERDSLSHKLIRLLERELAEVAAHDPHVPSPTSSLEDAVDGADAIVVATNHSAFTTPQAVAAITAGAAGDAVLADPWNTFGQGEVFSAVAWLRAAGAQDAGAEAPRAIAD